MRGLQSRGVEMAVEGNRIRMRGRGERLSAAERETLSRCKGEIIAFLRATPPDNQAKGDKAQAPATADTDAFQERAAIAEFDGGLSRTDAPRLATEMQRYDRVSVFRAPQTKRGTDNPD